MVSATVQLIILKPIIALVFAVGFGMAGQSSGIPALLQGLLVLALAVFAWPVIARFFTFATIQAASSGLSTALGFALGATAGRTGGGQRTAGVDPDKFSQSMEDRIMASRGGAASSSDGGGGLGGAGGSPGQARAAERAVGGGAAGGGAVLAGIGLALRTAQQVGNAMAGRMEQTAAHAGMSGAYPYSTVAGTPRYGAAQPPQRLAGGAGQHSWPGQQTGERVRGRAAASGRPAQFPDEPGAPSGYDGDADLDGGDAMEGAAHDRRRAVTPDRQSRSYGGWQQEKVAFIFGLSVRRAAILAAAILAVIMPIATGKMSAAVTLWPVAAVLAATVMIRFQGRTGDEWAASAVSWALIAVPARAPVRRRPPCRHGRRTSRSRTMTTAR